MAFLTDSHCHLTFEPLASQLSRILHNARGNAVGCMLCVSVNLEGLPLLLQVAQEHDEVYASVGVHPAEHAGEDPETARLVALADNPRVVAIGETGLDYYHPAVDAAQQQERFRRHIRAARECGKPLIVHTREAAADTLRILREENAQEVGGVMHCFTENWDTADAALDLGFYISFSGILTFRNADALRGVAERVPLERLLIETDSPYLAPVPFRGKTNEPAFVREVAGRLAALRALSLGEIAGITTGNFFRLFSTARMPEPDRTPVLI